MLAYLFENCEGESFEKNKLFSPLWAWPVDFAAGSGNAPRPESQRNPTRRLTSLLCCGTTQHCRMVGSIPGRGRISSVRQRCFAVFVGSVCNVGSIMHMGGDPGGLNGQDPLSFGVLIGFVLRLYCCACINPARTPSPLGREEISSIDYAIHNVYMLCQQTSLLILEYGCLAVFCINVCTISRIVWEFKATYIRKWKATAFGIWHLVGAKFEVFPVLHGLEQWLTLTVTS